ncbi:hypothetical protein GW17_00047386 [Ensete ventricosum]|nr:hypothetical protein GW17_00047386 [Ensete ventricosum]
MHPQRQSTQRPSTLHITSAKGSLHRVRSNVKQEIDSRGRGGKVVAMFGVSIILHSCCLRAVTVEWQWWQWLSVGRESRAPRDDGQWPLEVLLAERSEVAFWLRWWQRSFRCYAHCYVRGWVAAVDQGRLAAAVATGCRDQMQEIEAGAETVVCYRWGREGAAARWSL